MTKYVLKRAKIESSRLPDDNNRYLCRALPEFESIKEVELLPEYPFFLKLNQTALLKGDIVWCLVTEDYGIGYILGLCENPEGRSILSILDEINTVEKEFNLPVSEYSDISFSIEDHVFLDFSNKKTRVNGRLNYAGSLLVYTSDGSILMKALSTFISMGADGDLNIVSQKETHEVKGDLDLTSASYKLVSGKRDIKLFKNSFEEIGGDRSLVVLGGNQEAYTKASTKTYLSKKKEVIGQGEIKTVVLGGSKTTVLAGDYSVFVGSGSLNLTSSAGLNLTAGPNGIKIISGGPVDITAPSVKITTASLDLAASLIKTGVGAVGGSVGPFCSIPFCLFTGAKHSGNTFTGV